MRIVVTGSSGRIGQHVVRELAEHDYEVIATDLARAPVDLPRGVQYVQGDMTVAAEAAGVLAFRGRKPDAVIHLAAIPSPVQHTMETVYATNVLSGYNIAEMAATLGIPKLVETSSINWLGMDFRFHEWWPDSLPVDERHPHQAQDAYALSKFVGEETAKMIHNRAGTEVISIRPPYVVFVDWWPDVVRRVREEPLSFASGLWAYIDVRDLAVAFRLALETTVTQHEPFYIVADDALAERPVAELAAQISPELGEKAKGITGSASGVSNAKAKRMLNWQPHYSWRDFA
jgi:nucleoside-diphosphate-sugar epimerase